MLIYREMKRCKKCNTLLVPDMVADNLKGFTGKEYMCINCQAPKYDDDIATYIETDVTLYCISSCTVEGLFLRMDECVIQFESKEQARRFANDNLEDGCAYNIIESIAILGHDVTNGRIIDPSEIPDKNSADRGDN